MRRTKYKKSMKCNKDTLRTNYPENHIHQASSLYLIEKCVEILLDFVILLLEIRRPPHSSRIDTEKHLCFPHRQLERINSTSPIMASLSGESSYFSHGGESSYFSHGALSASACLAAREAFFFSSW